MFTIIRTLIVLLLGGIVILKIRKSKIVHKRRACVITVVVIGILAFISSLSPIENTFISFSSPEQAYNYVNPEQVQLVVSGTTTDFVIGQKKPSDFVVLIIPKTEKGWKVGRGLDTKRVIDTYTDGVAIHVYQYKDTDEYYIVVGDINGKIKEISDNYNSEFYSFDGTDGYYAYVHNLVIEDYLLSVNGIDLSIVN